MPARPRSGLRSTLLVSAATMASRLLGLLREQLFASLVGAGFFADAFEVAYRIPNLLRDLFAEGALSAAFVPTFAKVEQDQGREAAHQLANRVIGAITLIVGAITLLGMLFAAPLVSAMASGFTATPGKAELTAKLAQVMMPFLPMLSLAAVMMGMLNARGQFGTPALAPALFNIAAIVAGLGLKLAGATGETAVVGWSLATLVGGALQFLVQIPPLWRDGFRLRPLFAGIWQDAALRRIGRLMTPATLGLAATQLNIFVNTQFASGTPGANAWLNYAFRLMYLPIGIFGVAIATVTASTLARKAAEKDIAGLKLGLGMGLRHTAFLTIPSTVGLMVMAAPVIGLIYQHGRFQASDTDATALALVGYAVGLYAYSAVKVIAPAFYALDRPRLPLIASACAVAANLLLNFSLHHRIGFVGLALGTSIGAWLNILVLGLSFGRLTPTLPWPKGILSQLGKVTLASLVMGGVVHVFVGALPMAAVDAGVHIDTLPFRLVLTLGGVALGGVVYAGLCRLLRISEMQEILDALKRRRAR